jgi:SH3-like domain-containing protein
MNCKNIILLGTLCLSCLCPGNAPAEMVSVKGEDINMRSGPGTTYSVLYTLGSGIPLDVIKRSDDWLQVKDFEGEIGWVHQVTVSSTPQVIVKANRDSNSEVNVRSGPGIENKIVAKAFYGVVFKIIGEKGRWVEVEHGQGVKGWIDRSFLWGI